LINIAFSVTDAKRGMTLIKFYCYFAAVYDFCGLE